MYTDNNTEKNKSQTHIIMQATQKKKDENKDKKNQLKFMSEITNTLQNI